MTPSGVWEAHMFFETRVALCGVQKYYYAVFMEAS